MLPALRPGDGVFAVTLRQPRVGQVVVFESPLRPGMWLIKRVVGTAGSDVELDGCVWPVGSDEMLVMSDNAQATLADSRTFGPIPLAGAWRMIGRPVRGAR